MQSCAEPVGDSRVRIRLDSWLCLLLIQTVGFFPVWNWYWQRMTDRSDEPWGICAILVLLWLCIAEGGKRSALRERAEIPLASLFFLGLYLVFFPVLVPLARATLAMLSVGTLIARNLFRGSTTGVWGLLLVSLPVIPTLQFYLGYPMRVVTAWFTVRLLGLASMPVIQRGTALELGEKLVLIDAPCSGIKMAWTASFLCAALCLMFQLPWRRALLLSAFASSAVIGANVIRSAFLFFLEIKNPGYPEWLHPAIGTISFCAMGAGVFVVASLLRTRQARRGPSTAAQQTGLRAAMLLVLCAAAFAAPLSVAPSSVYAKPTREPAWPAKFDGKTLRELPLSDKEARFRQDFPGQIKRFAFDDKELIVRHLSSASRKLHPAADCLKGVGYEIKAAHALAVEREAAWSCIIATRDGRSLKVCESIRDAEGRSYSDVSTWYWAVMTSDSRGPWEALTLSESLSAVAELPARR